MFPPLNLQLPSITKDFHFPQQANVPQTPHVAKPTPLYTPVDQYRKEWSLIVSAAERRAEGEGYLNDDEGESGTVGAQTRSQR